MFSKIFSWIKKLVKKIIDAIKAILPYIMIALAIFFALGGGFTFALFGSLLEIGGMWGACLAMGISFLVAPEETAAVVGKVADGLGKAAVAVGSASLSATTALGSEFLSSPLGLGLIAVGIWYFFLRNDDGNKERPASSITDASSAMLKEAS